MERNRFKERDFRDLSKRRQINRRPFEDGPTAACNFYIFAPFSLSTGM